MAVVPGQELILLTLLAQYRPPHKKSGSPPRPRCGHPNLTRTRSSYSATSNKPPTARHPEKAGGQGDKGSPMCTESK